MKRRPAVVLEWKERHRPNARERFALALAAVALSPGRYEVRRGRARRENPDTARAYREFHWGEPAKSSRTVRVPNARELYELGKIVRVDYLTSKGGKEGIWFHEFSDPLPTLTATPGGKLGPIVGGRARVTERGIEG